MVGPMEVPTEAAMAAATGDLAMEGRARGIGPVATAVQMLAPMQEVTRTGQDRAIATGEPVPSNPTGRRALMPVFLRRKRMPAGIPGMPSRKHRTAVGWEPR